MHRYFHLHSQRGYRVVSFLVHQENALLVHPENEHELANAISTIYQDHALKNKLAQNNKEKIKQFYIDKIASEYIQIFQDIIHKAQ